jgi:23S rRNA (adenine2503-C2)-methyltransferase
MRLVHSLTSAELVEACHSLKQPVFRAGQIWRWLYVQRVDTWGAMTNLPVDMREKLAADYSFESGTVADQAGPAGEPRKLLVQFADREQVETVLIPARRRLTLCVSSQAGCRFACAFCASGQAGFQRNLDAGEMVGQVLCGMRVAEAPVTHVVFMGIGEPLDNYDAVLCAARIMNDSAGLNIGARRLTISTCGIVPGIRRLASEGVQFELSVSLHAAEDGLRSRLMPVNRIYPLEQLLLACRDYAEGTGRIITFEYTMVRGLNDSPECLRDLVAALRDIRCRVNLIPLSPVQEFAGAASVRERVDAFVAALGEAGINTTIRASRGASVQAACGQLRYRKPPR